MPSLALAGEEGGGFPGRWAHHNFTVYGRGVHTSELRDWRWGCWGSAPRYETL